MACNITYALRSRALGHSTGKSQSRGTVESSMENSLAGPESHWWRQYGLSEHTTEAGGESKGGSSMQRVEKIEGRLAAMWGVPWSPGEALGGVRVRSTCSAQKETLPEWQRVAGAVNRKWRRQLLLLLPAGWPAGCGCGAGLGCQSGALGSGTGGCVAASQGRPAAAEGTEPEELLLRMNCLAVEE